MYLKKKLLGNIVKFKSILFENMLISFKLSVFTWYHIGNQYFFKLLKCSNEQTPKFKMVLLIFSVCINFIIHVSCNFPEELYVPRAMLMSYLLK